MAPIQHNKILLTGASGFIALHVLDLLLKNSLKVVATVRSESKADSIKKIFAGKPVEIAFVKDIGAPDAFHDVFEKYGNEITGVLHTASPFFAAKEDPLKELLDPAVKGTKNVLAGIKQYGKSVRQVVVTSSFAAISNVAQSKNPDFLHTESTWADVTWEDAIAKLDLSYRGSKKFAELAVWEFEEKEKPNFTVTTVNPPIVYGPLLQPVASPSQLNTSAEVIYNLIHSEPSSDLDKYSESDFLWVDARDIAKAHVIPLFSEPSTIDHQRLFVTPGYYSQQDILDILNKDLPELKGKIPVGKPGTGGRNRANFPKFDNTLTNSLLSGAPIVGGGNSEEADTKEQFKYYTLETTIVDTVKSLLELEKNW